jgi:NAD(P)-dependent dehydrogenase (short-subunit alcohol dehydrogenase family)
MKNELKKQVCVVTGAAAGIGLGIAEAFARAGGNDRHPRR